MRLFYILTIESTTQAGCEGYRAQRVHHCRQRRHLGGQGIDFGGLGLDFSLLRGFLSLDARNQPGHSCLCAAQKLTHSVSTGAKRARCR